MEIQQIVKEHHTYLLRLAKGLCKDEDTAKDLVQDTYLKVIGALSNNNYTELSLGKSWLSRVLTNVFKDGYRSKVKESNYHERFIKEEFVEGEEDKTGSSVDLEVINNILNQLPPINVEIVRLRAEGYKFEEISHKLEVHLSTVKHRYFNNEKFNKVREKLRQY
jgi:RNA polymerase sigma-70 factor, ECF subfamily